MEIKLLVISHNTGNNIANKVEALSRTYFSVPLADAGVELEIYIVYGTADVDVPTVREMSENPKPNHVRAWYYLQLPVGDGYYDLTNKTVQAFQFFKNIGDSAVVIKTDDDVYIDLNILIGHVRACAHVPTMYLGRVNYVSLYWHELNNAQRKRGVCPLSSERAKEVMLHAQNSTTDMLTNIVMKARLWHWNFGNLHKTPTKEDGYPDIYRGNFENLYCSGACYCVGGKLLKSICALHKPEKVESEIFEDKYVGDLVTAAGGRIFEIDNELYYDFQVFANIDNERYGRIYHAAFVHLNNQKPNSLAKNFFVTHFIKTNAVDLSAELWENKVDLSQPCDMAEDDDPVYPTAVGLRAWTTGARVHAGCPPLRVRNQSVALRRATRESCIEDSKSSSCTEGGRRRYDKHGGLDDAYRANASSSEYRYRLEQDVARCCRCCHT